MGEIVMKRSKHTKQKSRLRSVDLDAVLRLQKDYDELTKDVENLFMYIYEMFHYGQYRHFLEPDNGHIVMACKILGEAFDEGRIQPKREILIQKK
jgi:hypothetical protein